MIRCLQVVGRRASVSVPTRVGFFQRGGDISWRQRCFEVSRPTVVVAALCGSTAAVAEFCGPTVAVAAFCGLSLSSTMAIGKLLWLVNLGASKLFPPPFRRTDDESTVFYFTLYKANRDDQVKNYASASCQH